MKVGGVASFVSAEGTMAAASTLTLALSVRPSSALPLPPQKSLLPLPAPADLSLHEVTNAFIELTLPGGP
jgi:hypothetical protein